MTSSLSILLMISPKEFIELNVNTGTMINVKYAELNIKIAIALLNTRSLKMIWMIFMKILKYTIHIKNVKY